MEYIGGISEFNYSPIQDFNKALKENDARLNTAVSDGINSVNNDAVNAERAEEILASGGDISAHEVIIAAEKSNLSLQMAVQIRNRLLNAYTEINSMQI